MRIMRNLLFPVLALAALSFSSTSAPAWNGTDVDTGTTVTINDRKAVRMGSIVELYDASSGRYHDVDVDSITQTKTMVRLQVYDYNVSRARTFEMQIKEEHTGPASQTEDVAGL